MCNLAGYVGRQQAAPVLIELLSRQEGWAGGYYTGLATVDNGRLHSRKVVGDLAELLRCTDAADLPGTTGIIHSRSKSGGDVEWGHPFTSPGGDLAYVANGHLGFFESGLDIPKTARELEAAGYTFRSDDSEPKDSYPFVSPGRWVHFSELMCNSIHLRASRSGSLLQGLREAYQSFPGEIVGLCVSHDDCDGVYAARINQPLMIGRSEDGVYMSTTALAFPDHIPWINPFPISSVGRLSVDHIEILPFDAPPGPVQHIIPWGAVEAAVRARLDDGVAKGLGELKNATAHLWENDCAPQKDLAVYEVLRQLIRSGDVEIVRQTRPGVLSDTEVPFLTARMV